MLTAGLFYFPIPAVTSIVSFREIQISSAKLIFVRSCMRNHYELSQKAQFKYYVSKKINFWILAMFNHSDELLKIHVGSELCFSNNMQNILFYYAEH